MKTIENRDIALVPIDADGITDEYVGWLNDPSTFHYMGTKFGQTRESVREYVASVRPPNVLCRIVIRESGRHVGNIALHLFDPIHRRMDLGIVIGDPAMRGAGIGTQACRLIIDYAFTYLNLHKITAGTVDENAAMKRVFLGLGFRVEGTLVEHHFLGSRYHDVLLFGLLRREFRSGPGEP
ncbi:MAG: GNAT family N-acetyltransferase [Acidobacteria bacterium]|nr:GNAT family N-acetyltransferase [Acidobacteriota bacterium]